MQPDRASREACVDIAAPWLAAVCSPPDAPSPWLLGEYDVRSSLVLRLVGVSFEHSLGEDCRRYASDRARPPAVCWARRGDMPRGIVREVACAALERFASFVRPSQPVASALAVGRLAAAPVARSAAVDAHALRYDAAELRCRIAEREVRSALAAHAASRHDEGRRSFFASCADRVLPLPIAEVPTALRSQLLSCDDARLDLLPFAHSSGVATTAARRPRREPPTEWPPGVPPPTCEADVLVDAAFRQIAAHLERLDAWHVERSDGREAKRPRGRVWGLQAVKPVYRELLAAGGTIMFPADAPPRLLRRGETGFETHTRVPVIAERLRGCTDREVVDFMCSGVDTAIDRPPCVALPPNLLGLYPDRVRGVAQELGKFRVRGWAVTGAARDTAAGRLGLPCIPFFASPTNGTDKKEGGVRVLGDMGWPRRPLPVCFSTGGDLCESNNVIAKRKQEVPEIKPTLRDAMHNAAVIQRPCRQADLGHVAIGFDFHKMFHQFWYVWHKLWQMGAIVPTLLAESLSPKLSASLNFVLAMGFTSASGIAQRAANAWLWALFQDFDAREAAVRHLEPPAIKRWLRARDALPHDSFGTQARLADGLCYTDDTLLQCAGPPSRVIRLCECFYDLFGPGGMNILLAESAKWLLSSWNLWIGAAISPMLGLVWLPPAKALRAEAQLRELASGRMSYADAIRLAGFLEHLAQVLILLPYLVRRVWSALRRHERGGRAHADIVEVNAAERGALFALRRLVVNTPGVSVMRAVVPTAAPAAADTEWILSSDACFDIIVGDDGVVCRGQGVAPPGMGGSFYGWLWHREFTTSELQLYTIPVAEFVAAIVHLIVCATRLTLARRVVLEIDALATPYALRRHAQSDGLQAAHEEFMASPVFAEFMRPHARLHTRHVFGPGNAGDAPSRGYRAEAERACLRLGLTPEWRDLPPAAEDYIGRVTSRLRLLHPGGRRPARHSTSAGVRNPHMTGDHPFAQAARPPSPTPPLDGPDSPPDAAGDSWSPLAPRAFSPATPPREDTADGWCCVCHKVVRTVADCDFLHGLCVKHMCFPCPAHAPHEPPVPAARYRQRSVEVSVDDPADDAPVRGTLVLRPSHDAAWRRSQRYAAAAGTSLPSPIGGVPTGVLLRHGDDISPPTGRDGVLGGGPSIDVHPNIAITWHGFCYAGAHDGYTAGPGADLSLQRYRNFRAARRLVGAEPCRFPYGGTVSSEHGPTPRDPADALFFCRCRLGCLEPIHNLGPGRTSHCWACGWGAPPNCCDPAQWDVPYVLPPVLSTPPRDDDPATSPSVATPRTADPASPGGDAYMFFERGCPSRLRGCDPAEPGGTAFRFRWTASDRHADAENRPPPMHACAPPPARSSGVLVARLAAFAATPTPCPPVASPLRATAPSWLASYTPSERASTHAVSRKRALCEAAADSGALHGVFRRAASAAQAACPDGPERAPPPRVSAVGSARVDAMVAAHNSEASPWALRPHEPAKLRELCQHVVSLQEHAAPDSTLDKERSAFRRYWEPYCAEWRTPPIRPDVARLSHDERMLEAAWWAGALPWIQRRMPSRAGVVGLAKPTSVIAVLRHVRRAHKRLQIDTVSLAAAASACDGMLRDYIHEHGPEALVPRRKEPLTNGIICALLNMPDGTRLGKRQLDWAHPDFSSLRALYAVLAQTGMRKAEVALGDKATHSKVHLSLASVRWCIGGRFVDAPTPELLSQLADGDYALLTPPPSKADQFSLHWGACTIYLMYRSSAVAYPICAARELAREELRRAVPAALRRTAPLFMGDSGPWRQSALAATFKRMMVVAVGAERADSYTIHSFRIYLACALLAAGASTGTIQNMLRWRSDDALRIYARINDFRYADWLERAGAAHVSSVRTTTPGADVLCVAEAMQAAARGAVGDAQAGFQTVWQARAAASADVATAAAAGSAPEVDADSLVAELRGSMAAIVLEAERQDALED